MATLLLNVMSAYADFERAPFLEHQRGGWLRPGSVASTPAANPRSPAEQAGQVRERAAKRL